MLFHTQGALVVSSVLMAATSAVAKDFQVLPRGAPLGTLQGCYSSIPGYGKSTSWTYQSSGWCLDHCAKDSDYAAFALTGGSGCVCGNTLPPASSKVSNSKCDKSCSGWPDDMCMSISPIHSSHRIDLLTIISNRWWSRLLLCLYHRFGRRCSHVLRVRVRVHYNQEQYRQQNYDENRRVRLHDIQYFR